MLRKTVGVTLAVLLLLATIPATAWAGATMSYQFEFFNNANARQVAFNIANRQRELQNEEDEMSTIERFQESLERQIINRAIREIVDSAFDPDGEIQEGWYQVGDDIIYFERNEDGEMVVTYIDADGNLTEIIITRDVEAVF